MLTPAYKGGHVSSSVNRGWVSSPQNACRPVWCLDCNREMAGGFSSSSPSVKRLVGRCEHITEYYAQKGGMHSGS